MTDIALFAEDPGAIAYLDGVPEALAKMGYTSERIVLGQAILPPLVHVGGTGENQTWALLLESARKLGIPTVGLVDGCTSVEHRAKGLRNADYVATPDEETRQAYIALGFDPKRVRACGHPGHDALYAMRQPKPWSSVPALMLATEPPSSCDPLLDYDRRTEDAIERFLAAAETLAPSPRLVLRLHPKTPSGLYSAYRGRFDGQSAGGPASDAILAADVVVGLTSSILDEAVILGRPALSIAPPAERASLAGWRHGLIPAASEPDETAAAIRRLLPVKLDPAAVEAAFPRGGALKVAELIADAISEQMPTLEGEGIRLEPFTDRHMTACYIGWLNDPETVRYSEQRHLRHTAESCAEYRKAMAPPNKFWAILAPPFGHVGGVTATVDKWNRVADLAILVERTAWGCGIGTKAWQLALDWLLGQGGMRKVTAGTMAENHSMQALMWNSGMIEEGRQRGRFLFDGAPVDAIMAAKER